MSVTIGKRGGAAFENDVEEIAAPEAGTPDRQTPEGLHGLAEELKHLPQRLPEGDCFQPHQGEKARAGFRAADARALGHRAGKLQQTPRAFRKVGRVELELAGLA